MRSRNQNTNNRTQVPTGGKIKQAFTKILAAGLAVVSVVQVVQNFIPETEAIEHHNTDEKNSKHYREKSSDYKTLTDKFASKLAFIFVLEIGCFMLIELVELALSHDLDDEDDERWERERQERNNKWERERQERYRWRDGGNWYDTWENEEQYWQDFFRNPANFGGSSGVTKSIDQKVEEFELLLGNDNKTSEELLQYWEENLEKATYPISSKQKFGEIFKKSRIRVKKVATSRKETVDSNAWHTLIARLASKSKELI